MSVDRSLLLMSVAQTSHRSVKMSIMVLCNTLSDKAAIIVRRVYNEENNNNIIPLLALSSFKLPFIVMLICLDMYIYP